MPTEKLTEVRIFAQAGSQGGTERERERERDLERETERCRAGKQGKQAREREREEEAGAATTRAPKEHTTGVPLLSVRFSVANNSPLARFGRS
jgi:hypothetical protein